MRSILHDRVVELILLSVWEHCRPVLTLLISKYPSGIILTLKDKYPLLSYEYNIDLRGLSILLQETGDGSLSPSY